MEHHDVVIIGGGPAGISTAIWCKRLKMNHLLIEAKDQLGGQLLNVYNEIIDYPGVIYTNGRHLQQNLVDQLQKLGCHYSLSTNVHSIFPNKKKIIVEKNGKQCEISYHFLVLATGASPRKLKIPGEQKLIEKQLLYSASKDRDLFKNKHVAVIGGGDRAFEGALLLADAGAKVSLIHRSDRFKARKEYVSPVLKHPNIKIYKHSIANKIHIDDDVTGIDILTNGNINTINIQAVFIRIGVEPNTQFIKGYIETTPEGYIKTNQYTQSSNPALYAIGDSSIHPEFSSISLSVGQGMVCAKHISLQVN